MALAQNGSEDLDDYGFGMEKWAGKMGYGISAWT